MVREHIHLIGIGGTGMTALAGLLQASGCRVTGSDTALYPPTSGILAALGLEVNAGFDPARLTPPPDLVVVGNAVSRGNPEVEAVLDADLEYTSLPRLIGERFVRHRHAIVVAGTHGKTTTAAMLAWILHDGGLDPGFLIGGLPCNFPHPFALGRGRAFVIEGDEYDTAFFDKGPKFMHYRPDTVLLGTIEYDHADIYADLAEIKTAFRRLVNVVPRRGLVIRHEDWPTTREVSDGAPCRVQGYGLEQGAWRARNVVETGSATVFEATLDGRAWARIELPSAGLHNVRNALAAIAAAAEQGMEPRAVASALARFGGVRRRLETRGEVAGVVVLDDFAHHPTAIAHTLAAARARYPRARLWAVLEPRSWSLRKRVFQQRLGEAFDAADEVIVAGVYGATAIAEADRLDPEQLVADLTVRGRSARFLPSVEGIVALLAERTQSGDVITVMSNGAFGGLHERLLEALSHARQDRT